LVREGSLEATAKPHRATFDRHLRRRGASRRQLAVLGAKPTIKMRFDAFGDLWVGDYHHGPKVLAPDGRLTTAKLGAFIDHTTRYPVADRWYLAEDLGSLRDTMLRALLVWGPPKKAYTDRGAVYRAEQLAYSLAAVGSHLVHSRPYYSQGRGVIERWWQFADAFQAEIDDRDEPVTIHELNRLWEAFRTLRYLEVPHSDLGMSPAQAIASVTPRPIDPTVAHELFLVRADRTVNKKDATVSVEGRRFLCDATLRDGRVPVRYAPRDLWSGRVFVDDVFRQRALPQPIGKTGEDDPPPPPPPPGPKTDYLGMVRADYDRRLVESVRPVAYADLGTLDPASTRVDFSPSSPTSPARAFAASRPTRSAHSRRRSAPCPSASCAPRSIPPSGCAAPAATSASISPSSAASSSLACNPPLPRNHHDRFTRPSLPARRPSVRPRCA